MATISRGRYAELGELGGREFEKDLLFVNAVELNLADTGQLVEPVTQVTGDHAHLRHGKAIAGEGDAGHCREPELVVDEGADGPRGQPGADIQHPVADLLPDQVQVVKLVPRLRMDDGDALFGVRPDVGELRQGTQLSLQLARDQLLHVLRRHAGKEGGDHHLADHDGRIFLAGKVEELDQTEDDDGRDEDDRQPVGIERESRYQGHDG